MTTDKPKKGDRYIDDRFGLTMEIIVTKVASDGSWANIKVTQPNGATWTKRQPTPIPGRRV